MADERSRTEGGGFSERLRAATEPVWSDAVRHRFTRELALGTLDDAVMRRYLVQDYAFLDPFVRLVASAIVKAPTLADRVPLGRFLGLVTGTENTYFQRAFEALGVPGPERRRPVLRPVTQAFRGLMDEAIAAPTYTETLAPLVVFEWLYLSWAEAAADRKPAKLYHAEWITLHADPAFARFVAWLRGQLDREAPALSAEGQARVEALFRRAVELEEAFFDDAYVPR